MGPAGSGLRRSALPRRITICLALAIAALAAAAHAEDLKIRSPIIDFHELEFENNFVLGRGKTTVHELEYGLSNWFKPGIETELAADPGHGLHYDASAVEAFFQLTPQGKYWADLGLFAEFENTARRGDPRSLTFGPLVQKEARIFGLDTLHTINALFIKDVGAASIGAPSMLVAAQSRARLNPYIQPGFEYYGIVALGTHGEAPRHLIGPMVAGRVGFRELGIDAPGAIRYDAAYLRGLTRATDPNTVRVRVEFEFPL